MRLDPDEFNALNKLRTKEPAFVIEVSFDDANTDLMYFTNKTITGLTGTVFDKSLVDLSSTSQDLTPEKAHCSIGNIKFKCKDAGVSDYIATKTDEGKGLKGKRIRVYAGYAGMLWADFVPTQTQIVSKSIDLYEGSLTFYGADIQREMRKTLFILKDTALTATLLPGDLTIQVENTSAFEVVFQPPVASSIAPSQEIGIIKIENGDVFELIQWTSKDATHFYGCTRGILGTPIISVEVKAGERGEKVEEFVYMSAPALMVAYAMLTGSWYGYAGKFIPDHWQLGISTDYIKTSDFIEIPDLWDVNDIDAGVRAVVQDVSDEEGKAFIETQLYFMLSVYPPINALGEIGLERLAAISEIGGAETDLTTRDFVSHGKLREDLNGVVNRYVIKWDWSVKRQIFKRTNILIDQESIDFYKTAKTKVLKLKTLYGSSDSLRVIYNNFNNIRTRNAYAPFRLSGVLTPDHNGFEVGDTARVTLPSLNNLNRDFEVQYTSINWVQGGVQVDLFGSNGLAGPLIPETTTLVDTAFLTTDVQAANWLTPANFPEITSSAGVTHITSSITLAGHDDLGDTTAIYYCPEDLIQDLGAVITLGLNVQIRVAGYFTAYEDIDGSAKGYAGGYENTAVGANDLFSRYRPRNPPGEGVQGGVGRTSAGVGLKYERRGSVTGNGRKWIDGYRKYGDVSAASSSIRMPATYELRVDDSDRLIGLPISLIGCSGACGGAVERTYNTDGDNQNRANGGDGGDSGAGLCIISAGFSQGAGKKIDLSGTDGTFGGSYTSSSRTFHAGGGGGGHNGGLIIVSTNSAQYTEIRNEFNTDLTCGLTPVDYNLTTENWGEAKSGKEYISTPRGYPAARENRYQSFSRLIYLDASSTFSETPSEYVETEPSFTLTRYINDDQTSIEVSVTPPADTNYSYSDVYWRVLGTTGWTPAAPASHESVITVPSNGDVIEVEIRPVSVSDGVATLSGFVQQITAFDINGRTDVQLATVYPFSAITGLGIQSTPGTIFSSHDAEFEWSAQNNDLVYFDHYQVEIYSGAQLLRTERSVSPFYIYSYAKNIADYLNINASIDVYLSIEIRVKAVSKYYNVGATLYSGDEVVFSSTASTFNSPDNLRFVQSTRDQVANDIGTAEQNAKDYADNTFATQVLQASDIAALQSQIDGNITSWFFADAPTLINSPASGWGPVATKNQHLGDIYYDTDTGYAYRFQLDGVYSWQQLSDSDITAALSLAQTAQDTADGKRRVFVVTPTVPYDIGDLWDTGSGIKRSTVNRITAYDSGDWTALADVTDYDDNRISNSELDDAITGAATTADWGGVTGTGTPADNADVTDYADPRVDNNVATPYTIEVPSSNNFVEVTGSTIELTPGGELNWGQAAWSLESYSGGAYISFVSETHAIAYAIGLSTSPEAELSFTGINYAWLLNSNGTMQGWVSGSLVYVGPAYVAGDNFSISYDGVTVRWYNNGALKHSQAATAGQTLYMDSSWKTPLGKLKSLQFGPFTSNAWDDISGSPNSPANNADVTDYTDARIANNLLDTSDWNAGTTLPSGYTSLGGTADNVLAMDVGPYGSDEIVWECINSTSANLDAGGMYSPMIAIENDKSYRCSIWVKNTAAFQNSFGFWFDFQGGTECYHMNGDPRTLANPPLWMLNFGLPVDDKWYLLVAYIHAHNTTRTDNAGQGGIYDPVTGLNTFVKQDFKFSNATTHISLSADHISDSATLGHHVSYTRPRIDVINGNEPSVAELMGSADVTGSNTSADTTAVDGLGSSVVRSAAAIVYRNGAESFETVDWAAGTKTTIASSVTFHSGEQAILCTNVNTTTNSFTEEIITVRVPERIVQSFAGRKIRLSAFIKQPTGSDTQYCSFDFFGPSETDPSFAADFYLPNYTSWGSARKDFQMPNVPETGDWFIGIKPDHSNGTKAVLVDSLLIEPMVESADIEYNETIEAPIFMSFSSAGTRVSTTNTGITTSKISTGHYRVTHNSGFVGYGTLVSPSSSNISKQNITETSNYFDVKFYNSSSTLTDSYATLLIDYRYGT